jgi:hypothetical protein
MSSPNLADALAEAMNPAEEVLTEMPHFSVFRQPVGITFLAQVMEKQPRQISNRLSKCPVEAWHKHQGKDHPLYDFKTAMAYLVAPRANIEDWYSQQNMASLPPWLNKMFWDSAHQRNRVMLMSNDLWHTEDVQVVFGRVAMLIRQEVKNSIENLPDKASLTDEQYGTLTDWGNAMIEKIREVMVSLPREFTPMSDQIKDELETSGTMISEDE